MQKTISHNKNLIDHFDHKKYAIFSMRKPTKRATSDQPNEQTKETRKQKQNMTKIYIDYNICYNNVLKGGSHLNVALCICSLFTPFNRRKMEFYDSFIFFRILFGMQNVCTLKNDNNLFMVNKLRFTHTAYSEFFHYQESLKFHKFHQWIDKMREEQKKPRNRKMDYFTDVFSLLFLLLLAICIVASRKLPATLFHWFPFSILRFYFIVDR